MEKIIFMHTSRILKVVNSTRRPPNTLKIVVEERVPQAIWQTGDDFFFISQDSVLTEQLPNGYATSTVNFLRLVDISAEPALVGEHVETNKLLEFTSQIKAVWPAKTGTQIHEIQLPSRASPDIFIVSGKSWKVYMDLNANPARQLESLSLILNKEIPPDKLANLAYIDLRLGNTAYYCFRNEPCDSITTPQVPSAE